MDLSLKKYLIYIVITFIILVLLISTQFTGKKPSNSKTDNDYLIILNKNLDIREGPGLSYPILKRAKEGQAIEQIEQQGEWIKVVTEHEEGWIPAWLINTDEMEHTTKLKIAVSNVNGLNVRAEPTTSAAVLTQLSIGIEVIVEKEENEWVKIDDRTGTTGWVAKEFITINERSSEEIEVSFNPNLEQQQSHFIIKVKSVNVREQPNLSSDIVSTAYQGDTFEVIEQNNNWIKIQLSQDKVGWLYRFYGIYENSKTTNNGVDQVTILYGGTNLRESPTTSSHVVKRADIGETFEILSTEGEWYEVAINPNKTAYVAKWVVSATLIHENKSKDVGKIERKKGTLNGVTIVLDPGHGGNDQGTSGYRGSIEKDITLLTAQTLQAKLQNAGATVYLTRESDVYVDLRKRVSISHNYAADAFISIHYDSTEDTSISGFTTYYYHDYQQKLAEYINNHIGKKVTLRNRGAQPGDYLVLRENYQNAILIELGYLSNPIEERVITTDFYREQATLGIYQGIINYFDSQL